MRTFSYTMSQKKQKKIKISNTNREPYLNHSTLISSNYDNVSGIKIIEYMKDIHVTNISNEFINYFNAFITETGTQDLSNFFDIEIKNISTNLKQLIDNVDDKLIVVEKNIYQSSVMKINETFNINKDCNSSFILFEDNNQSCYLNNLSIDINVKNPINFLYNEENDKLNISDTLINLELNIDTDFKKFNNFLNNTIINTNYSLEDKKKEFTLNELRKSCNCIINVYQLVYNENKIASGLGDFIRGSYFLIDFCEKYNFKYFIDISNHPIKNFLKKLN